MPLPVLTKTWQVSRNNQVPSQGSTLEHSRLQLRTLKNLLTGFASSPWTVSGSSNATAAGMDSVDRWASNGSLVWNNSGSAHSWIVLRQTAITTNYEVCIDLNSTFERFGSVIVSPTAGFTGGSTTNRPTATDEIVMINGSDIHSELDVTSYIDVWLSTDGEATRLCIWRSNFQHVFWLFEKPRNPRTGWTNPNVALTLATASGVLVANFGNLYRAMVIGNGRSRIGSTTAIITFTGEGSGDNNLLANVAPTGTLVNDIDGAWDFSPIGLASSTVNARGRHGLLHDLWWAPVSVGQGDTVPNNPNDRQFVKFGDLWLPWNPGGSDMPLMT